MKEQLVYLGVDTAKSYLDAAVENEKRRFSNDAIGHRELIKWVKGVKAPVQVIWESSGGYERRLVQALAGARINDRRNAAIEADFECADFAGAVFVGNSGSCRRLRSGSISASVHWKAGLGPKSAEPSCGRRV